MKVFISHKKEDAALALQIKNAFNANGVLAYLDLLDSNMANEGKALTDHIKENLNKCTDIIVIMSENTKYSWWVPFEIGMSAQTDMPTASFLAENVALPSYLSYWPRLRSVKDVATYVAVRNSVQKQIRMQYGYRKDAATKSTETAAFYAELKKRLSVR